MSNGNHWLHIHINTIPSNFIRLFSDISHNNLQFFQANTVFRWLNRLNNVIYHLDICFSEWKQFSSAIIRFAIEIMFSVDVVAFVVAERTSTIIIIINVFFIFFFFYLPPIKIKMHEDLQQNLIVAYVIIECKIIFMYDVRWCCCAFSFFLISSSLFFI